MAHSNDRRAHERKPIRLKVGYKTAHSLVTEYTKSISKGGCSIETKSLVPLGTRFVFEMYVAGLSKPVEVEGQVVRTSKASPEGTFEIGIEYLASDEKRTALEAVVDRIFAEHQWEKTRRHPRIPVNIVARDANDPKREYLIRDVSLGGMGLRLPGATSPPPGVGPGTPVLISVEFDKEPPIEIGGEVSWVASATKGLADAGIGLQFEELGPRERTFVLLLTRLRRPRSVVFTFLAERSGG